MELRTTSEFQAIYPAFVLHKHFEMPAGFNDHLYELARVDAERYRVRDAEDPRATGRGKGTTHLNHLRHNFLTDTVDPAIPVLVQMVQASIREYLQLAYGYDHQGEILMMSDAFYQSRALGQNVGIASHTHAKFDFVCTYYPRIVLDADCPQTPLHRGSVRFYDPANLGKRLWPCENPGGYVGGWYSVEPREGSMVVFEGHLPHDSTYFAGAERMCIPVLCTLDLPNSHRSARVGDIMQLQKGGQNGL